MADVIEKAEKEGIDALQHRIFTWWHAFVDKMQTEVALIIA